MPAWQACRIVYIYGKNHRYRQDQDIILYIFNKISNRFSKKQVKMIDFFTVSC